MVQQTSPWVEGKYGWNFGESGWNTGMDENLLKFSFMFDRNLDSITASLPAAVNGQAHYLTTDNRIYFAVGSTYYSTPAPKWATLVLRTTGATYQFNGTTLEQIDSPADLDSRLDSLEVTASSLGTAAFEEIGFFATKAELNIVEAQAQSYTDTLRGDLQNSVTGASNIGYSGRLLSDRLSESIYVGDYGAVGDGVTDDTIPLSNAHAAAESLGAAVFYGQGKTYVCGNFQHNKSVAVGNNSFWKIEGSLIPIPTIANETSGEVTYYVSPTGSDLLNNGLSPTTPFLTMQHCINKIPNAIRHRTKMKLTDGIHNQGSAFTDPIPGASTVREVRCLIQDKSINGRDYLVIEGNPSDKALVTIQHNDVYSAVYVEETNGVVLKDVTIDFSSNPSAAISIFQHRKGDMRISDVTILGNDFAGSHGIIAETGGFIELAGAITLTNIERGIVSLEAVISFIGTSLSHTGGTAPAARTFELGSQGEIYIFTGTLTASGIQRLVWNKGGYALCSPTSSTINATGFILDAERGTEIVARNISASGGARAVNAVSSMVTLETSSLVDQTTSSVYATRGAIVRVDSCALSDSTNTKNICFIDGSELHVYGTSTITGGAKGIFGSNSTLSVESGTSFAGGLVQIYSRGCQVRLLGVSGTPILFGTYGTNAWVFKSSIVTMSFCTVTNPASKTACIAEGTQIDNEGAVLVSGGFRGFDLGQNSSLTASTSTNSSLTNMTEGVNARRGSQVYYRSSSMSFTGTTTPTVANASEFSLVVAF